jgi:hypothetical protein
VEGGAIFLGGVAPEGVPASSWPRAVRWWLRRPQGLAKKMPRESRGGPSRGGLGEQTAGRGYGERGRAQIGASPVAVGEDGWGKERVEE